MTAWALSHAGQEVTPQQWYAMGYADLPFCPDSVAMDTTLSDFMAGVVSSLVARVMKIAQPQMTQELDRT